MAYVVKKIEVWAGDFLNRPGVLARLLEALSHAGAELEFLVGRRVSEKTSRVFVAPLNGKRQKAVANEVGFVSARGMHAIRIEGPDRAGLGAEIARAVAAAGINIRGVSAAAIHRNAVFYLGFKTEDEARKAAATIRGLLRPRARRRIRR